MRAFISSSAVVHNAVLKGSWKPNDWKWQNSLTFIRRFHSQISNGYYIITNIGSYSLCLLKAQGALQMNEKPYRSGEPEGKGPWSVIRAKWGFPLLTLRFLHFFSPPSHNLQGDEGDREDKGTFTMNGGSWKWAGSWCPVAQGFHGSHYWR